VHELTKRAWRKSTYSANEVHCVEFAEGEGSCAVRDSKDTRGPALMFPVAAWAAFSAGVRAGEFD
jgi:hypothetical protein